MIPFSLDALITSGILTLTLLGVWAILWVVDKITD